MSHGKCGWKCGFLGLMIVLGCLSTAWGASTPTWTGAGTSDRWRDGPNWNIGVAPVNDGTADIHFAGGVRLTPSVDSAYDINSLTFDATAGTFVIGGNPLTLERGGIVNNSPNPQTINAPILFGFGQSWNATLGALAFGGAINNNGRLLQFSGGFDSFIRSSLSGSGALTKNGGAALTLGNGAGDTVANTYTGLTTVNSGTLLLDKAAGTVAIPGDLLAVGGTVTANRAGQFSPASNVTLSGGTINFGDSNTMGSFTANSSGYGATANTLNLTSTAQYALTTASGLNLAHFNLTGASGGGINLPSGSNASTTIGNIGLGGVNRNINVADGSAADDLVIAGVVSGAGQITKTGPGTLALTASNTYSTGTTITEGAIRINTDEALGDRFALGPSVLQMNGGTLKISATIDMLRDVVFAPPGGTLDIATGQQLTKFGRLSGSGPMRVTGGGIVQIYYDQTIPSNPPGTYTGAIAVDSGELILSSNGLTSVVSDINVTGSANFRTDSWGASTSNVVLNTTGVFSNLAPQSPAKVQSLTLLSGAIVSLGTGALTAGEFKIGGGASTSASMIIDNVGVTALPVGSTPATMSGNIDLNGGGRTFDIGHFFPGHDLTISGVISNGAVTKYGRSNLELTGANTYSGGTTIDDGTLRIYADNALGAAGSPLAVWGIQGGVLRTSNTFTLSHPVSGYPEIIVDSGTTLTLAANVAGSALSKKGAGTLVVNSSTIGDNFVYEGTLALASDQSVGTPPARLWMIGGAVRAEGAARDFANALVVGSGANFAFDGNLDMTFNGAVTLNGAGSRITVNNTTAFNGAVGPTGTGHDFVKDGPGTLVLRGDNTIDSPITIDHGMLQLAGGVLNSPITNNDRFRYTAGTMGGRLSNFGEVLFDASTLTAPSGIANFGMIDLPAGTTLNIGAGGLDNQGMISGSGTITGSGAVSNSAGITPSGILVLSATGAISNSGEIEVATGSVLRLSGATLLNSGTIRMGGGILNGTSALNNQNGGTITGRGSVQVALGTSSGNIAVSDGTLNISSAFTNAGVIQMAGVTGTLAGGAITNTGTIQGFGNVNNAISNSTGTVEAVGGTLVMNAATSSSTGLLAAGSGNKLLFTQGLAANGGTMSLAGGTFDNGGKVISNTGQISGYGVLRSGGLTNNGAITFAGGTSTINGSVVNAAGKKIEVRFAPAVFTGAFTNNGIFKSTGAQVTFAGTYTENGQFISDPAQNFFENVVIGSGGAWSGGVGDRFIVGGDLINGSNAKQAWETSSAELSFVGGGVHTFAAPGSDLGITYSGYEDNFAWGRLVVGSGDSVILDGETVYVRELELMGGVGSIVGDGTLYYDLNETGNAYLEGKSYQLVGGGTIVGVPEPMGAFMVISLTLALSLNTRMRNKRPRI